MLLNPKGENVPLHVSIVKQISASTCMQRLGRGPSCFTDIHTFCLCLFL